MRRRKHARYQLIARNRPGELARLTDLLRSAGVSPTGLTVASLGDEEAAIVFSAPPLAGLPERLTRWGLREA
jgi:hypothetical protein